MSTEKIDANPDDKSPEVERIREIIFGPQMRTYEGNFQNIQRDLARLLQEIERLNEKLAEQDKDHGQKLQALERDVRKADDSLRAELRETAQKLIDEKVDRRVLGDLFIQLGNQLKSSGSIADTLKDMLGSKED